MASQYVNITINGDTEQVVCFNGAEHRPANTPNPQRGAMAEMIMFDHVFQNCHEQGLALQMNSVEFLRCVEYGLFTKEEIDSAVDLGVTTVTDKFMGRTHTGQRVLIPSVTSFTKAIVDSEELPEEAISQLMAIIPESFQLQIVSEEDCPTQETGVPLIELPATE